jgi:iron complex outermembrane recepter protein
MESKMKKFLMAASALTFVASSVSAFAQPAPSGGALEEIIVTAQKRTENLQEVPAAVSVVSAQELERRGVINLTSLQSLVPSLNFKDSATTLDSSVFLRGVGTINFSIAAEPSVGFVVDGVTYARSGEAFGDLYDVERIEVLRGPQGTLFGKNASAGVINVVTKRPGDTVGGFVDVMAATDEEYKARGAIDVPFSDRVAARITGNYAYYDGNVENVTLNRTVNGYKRYGVRGLLEAEASDTLDLTVIADWRKQNSDCCAELVGTVPAGALAGSVSGIAINGDKTRQIRQNTLTFTRETSWGTSLQGDLDVGEAGTLTSITAYRKYRNFGSRDGDFIDRVYNIGGGHQLDDFGPQPSRTFTQELRLTSPDDQVLEYVVGAFYYRAKQQRTFQRDDIVCSATTSAEVSPGLAPCLQGTSTLRFPSAVGTFGSTIENYAAFGNLTYNVSERFRLLAGGRLTRDNVDAFNNRVPASNGGGPGLLNVGANFNLSTDDSDFSLRGGAQFELTDTTIAYATFTEGYKGPAFNVFFNQNTSQLDPIAAETAKSYEAGLKFQTSDGRFTLNTAVFDTKYDNFQANSFVNLNGSVITQLTNAGSVSTQGIEFDALLRLDKNFSITAGLAYTDAQIDQFNIPPGAPATASTRKGEQLPLAPKYKGNLAASWLIETASFANVELNSNLSYTSSQVSALQAATTPAEIATRQGITIDNYTLLDASISLVDVNEAWRVTFLGRNLTDASYATLITPGGPGGSFRYLLPRDVDRYFGINVRLNY